MKVKKNHATWIHSLVSFLGTGFLYLVGKTTLVKKVDDPAYLEYRRLKKPIIYALWHNTQVFLAYAHRGERVFIMVSRSRDGEYIAQVMKHMRLIPVRGSTTRGGDQALREVIRLLEEGKQVGFTPDGPKGPPQTVHGGVVMAAKMSGCPLVPTTVRHRRKIVFNSWDKFMLPLPFGRTILGHGKPVLINKETSDEDAKEIIRKGLNQIEKESDEALRQASSWLGCFTGHLIRCLYSGLSFLLVPLWLPFLFMRYGIKRSFQNMKQRLGAFQVPPNPQTKRYWLHIASVGEWQAVKPFLAELKSDKDINLFLTVTSPEALKLISKEEPNFPCSLLPVDLPWIMKRWIKRVNPHVVFIVETELWPNMIHRLHKDNVPVFLINGRLSSRSMNRWRWFKPLVQNTLEGFSSIYARSQQDAKRFETLGYPKSRIEVTGNLKIDNYQITEESRKKEKRKTLFGSEEGLIVVGGSTQEGEEEVLLKILDNRESNSVKLILAPRRMERVAPLVRLLSGQKQSWTLWSRAKKPKIWVTNILLVDTLGDLKDLYQTADVAFIGGSLLPKGGQNPLEAASVGVPVLFGPWMDNFAEEAKELMEREAAWTVKDENDFLQKCHHLIGNPDKREQMGKKALSYVGSKQGVAIRTLDSLKSQLHL
ncbi:hypothetical protein BVX98_02695 [bacterium F11]|nr:hypothetical protein BVX98_02695 [bacterium F11]